MISKYQPVKKQNPTSEFSLMARNRKESFIVLFTSEKTGMIIQSDSIEKNEIGFYCTCWISCFDSDNWKILPKGDEIVLTQE